MAEPMPTASVVAQAPAPVRSDAPDEIAALKQAVAALRGELEGLRDELRQFKQSLGA